MSPETTSRTPWRYRPDAGTDGFVLVTIGCLLMMLWALAVTPVTATVIQRDPDRQQVLEPWTPLETATQSANTIASSALREGPFTLEPDALMTPSAGGFISLLGDGLNETLFERSAHSNDDSFQAGDWVPENVFSAADGARLDVTATGDRRRPYDLAEVRTRQLYGYGRYEVIMRPARGSGLVSSFFTYTGPYRGDPHDEIDIEFLGEDTTAIHFNYFRNGDRGHYASFALPFDAADADHLYAFDWKPEGLFWYVDGKLLYQTEPGDLGLPRAAAKIYFSNWTGKRKLMKWHGRPDFGDRGSAYYSCVSFTPLGQNTRRCSDIFRAGTHFPEDADGAETSY